MIESELIALISTTGFPIVMVLWFMFKTEKVINNAAEVIERNTAAMVTIGEVVIKCQRK